MGITGSIHYISFVHWGLDPSILGGPVSMQCNELLGVSAFLELVCCHNRMLQIIQLSRTVKVLIPRGGERRVQVKIGLPKPSLLH